MKSRLLLCATLFGLLAVPAFGTSISILFTNSGISSGNLTSGVMSAATNLAFDATVIEPGQFATLFFTLGSFSGSFKNGGTFTGGTFDLENGGSVIFESALSGTWSKVGKGLYDLAGNVSGVFDGVRYTGTTNQLFSLSFDDGHMCLKGLNGQTNLTGTVVPEPGTLALLGTGLVALAGAARKKLRRAVS